MKVYNYSFGILIFLVDITVQLAGYDIGSTCEYDSDCYVEHAFCRSQQVCECKRGFLPAPDNQNCIASVGAVCQSNYDCSSLLNSDCQQNICECQNGFVPDPNGVSCLPKTTQFKGPCQHDIQCQETFGDPSRCIINTCQCLPGHHFVQGKCIKSNGLFEPCVGPADCYIGDAHITMLECRGGQCRCLNGYYANEERSECIPAAGSRYIFPSVIVFIASLFILNLL